MRTQGLQIRLDSRRRRIAFIAAVSSIAVAFAGATLRIVIAQTWGESNEAAKVTRAVALDPRNPELHYRLGLLNLLDGTSFSVAARELQSALKLNAHPARYWLALGQACLVLGDDGCAGHAFERAVQQAPMVPLMERDAANYYAIRGNSGRVFAHSRRALELDPQSAEEVFHLVWDSNQTPECIWPELQVESKPWPVQCVYLDFLARQGRFDLAAHYWKSMASSFVRANPSLSSRPVFDTVKPYLQRLLSAGRYEEALTVWRDLAARKLIASDMPKQADGNVLFNGSFEQPILDAGFDWQMREQQYVRVEFSNCEAERHAGAESRCLRLEFTVPHNANDEAVYQLVPVTSNQQYHLTARLRSDAITSDSGPRIRVRDVQCSSCLDTSSESVLGTTGWHDANLTFSTGPLTKMVSVSVWRPRSRVFPMEITGVLWLDSVSLRPLTASN